MNLPNHHFGYGTKKKEMSSIKLIYNKALNLRKLTNKAIGHEQ
jgi:hypothetical protein